MSKILQMTMPTNTCKTDGSRPRYGSTTRSYHAHDSLEEPGRTMLSGTMSFFTVRQPGLPNLDVVLMMMMVMSKTMNLCLSNDGSSTPEMMTAVTVD